MLKSGVVLFLCMTIHFHKTYQTPADIVALLQSRGLNIDNPKRAEHYIRSIGYYRFSAYLYPLLQMPKEAHQYKVGSTFQDALNLYRFDKKLRIFLFNEIEKVEIALRSALANIAAEETGNIFWMTDVSMFANEDKFNRTMTLVDKELNNSKEDFILHFKKKYSNTYPPAWMLMEILPLGIVTRIYENIKSNALKKKISGYFNLPVPMFISWLTVITLTRNSCCHHSRVWNKTNAITTLSMKKMLRNWLNEQPNQQKVYYNLCLIRYFLNVISPANNLKEKLVNLFQQYPSIDLTAMGFTKGWELEPLWKE